MYFFYNFQDLKSIVKLVSASNYEVFIYAKVEGYERWGSVSYENNILYLHSLKYFKPHSSSTILSVRLFFLKFTLYVF